MENYFNYFTEIEEHYQRRRGSALLLSTLDWALIETWKDAGIPLEAALRGIDAAFETYDRKPARAKTKKINSLAYCSQEVLAAAEDIKEAATGAAREDKAPAGFAMDEIAMHLQKAATAMQQAHIPPKAKAVCEECCQELKQIASSVSHSKLEDLERRLTVLEEKLFAGLHAATPAAELLAIRTEADRDIAPYRRKMVAAQIEQLHRQYVNKRLLERARLPRLSLFYM